MSRTAWAWILAGLFLVLAGATRFYRLDWSFSGDETTSFNEVRTLSEKPFFIDNQIPLEMLPRGHPVAYGLHYMTYRLFGKGEFGARVGVATAGTLAVGVSVLLTGLLFGRRTALFLGILLLLWPWQLGHSQVNRHYSYAFLFGSTAMLSGALAFERNSFGWAALAGVTSACAVSSHNLAILIPAAFGVYLVLLLVTRRRLLPGRAIVGYAVVGVPLVAVSSFLAWYAMRGWVGAMEMYYSTIHTYLALAFNLGWGVALLAVVGWLWSWRARNEILRLFAVVAVLTLLACTVLPSRVPFRQDYVYSVSLAFFVLAAQVLVAIHERLRLQSPLLAWGIAGMIFLLPLPSLASYYQDGNRKEYRGAARYIEANWKDGDLVAADSNALLGFYLGRPVEPVPRPAYNADVCIERLSKLAGTGRRVWYVCRLAREEPPPHADQWLWRHAVRMRRFKKKRFDYHENVTDVYLLNAEPDAPGAAGRSRVEHQ